MTTEHSTLTAELHEALTTEAEAWAAMERAKLRCLNVEAFAGVEIRRKALQGGEKLTESQLAAWVALDTSVVEVRTDVINAELAYRNARADVAQVETTISLTKAAMYSQVGRIG